MADKTIADLVVTTTIAGTAVLPLDDGIQTKQITAQNLATGLQTLTGALDPVPSLREMHARNWNPQVTPASLFAYMSIAWSPTLKLFVASGTLGRVMYSADGVVWTEYAATGMTNLAGSNCVVWSSDLAKFLIVDTNGAFFFSTNGTSFSTAVVISNNVESLQPTSILYVQALGLYICATLDADNNAHQIWTSTTGLALSWTARSIPHTSSEQILQCLAWSPTLAIVVAVSADLAAGGKSTYWSTDGINWSQGTLAGVNNLQCVVWVPELALFVATGGTKFAWSADGKTWTAGTFTAGTEQFMSLAWSPELKCLMAVSQASGAASFDGYTSGIAMSLDGKTWVKRRMPLRAAYSVCWSDALHCFGACLLTTDATKFMLSGPAPNRNAEQAFKQYQWGTTYQNGTPAVTLTAGGGTLSSVQRCSMVPYQTIDGGWRFKFNLTCILSSVARTTVTITISGVTFKNVSNFSQAITAWNSAGVAPLSAYVLPNTGQVVVNHASGTTSAYYISGDVELDSKPTWLD